jgi:hypothetical protein
MCTAKIKPNIQHVENAEMRLEQSRRFSHTVTKDSAGLSAINIFSCLIPTLRYKRYDRFAFSHSSSCMLVNLDMKKSLW